MENNTRTIVVIKSILLKLSSVRTPPRVLLKPPVEMRSFISFQLLTPFQYSETFLGRKITIETGINTVVYLREKESGNNYRVMETNMTFLHIIEPDRFPEEILMKSPSRIPKELIRQLISITTNEMLPILITLFDKHMIPIALPINIIIKYNNSKEEEDIKYLAGEHL